MLHRRRGGIAGHAPNGAVYDGKWSRAGRAVGAAVAMMIMLWSGGVRSQTSSPLSCEVIDIDEATIKIIRDDKWAPPSGFMCVDVRLSEKYRDLSGFIYSYLFSLCKKGALREATINGQPVVCEIHVNIELPAMIEKKGDHWWVQNTRVAEDVQVTVRRAIEDLPSRAHISFIYRDFLKRSDAEQSWLFKSVSAACSASREKECGYMEVVVDERLPEIRVWPWNISRSVDGVKEMKEDIIAKSIEVRDGGGNMINVYVDGHSILTGTHVVAEVLGVNPKDLTEEDDSGIFGVPVWAVVGIFAILTIGAYGHSNRR